MYTKINKKLLQLTEHFINKIIIIIKLLNFFKVIQLNNNYVKLSIFIHLNLYFIIMLIFYLTVYYVYT